MPKPTEISELTRAALAEPLHGVRLGGARSLGELAQQRTLLVFLRQRG